MEYIGQKGEWMMNYTLSSNKKIMPLTVVRWDAAKNAAPHI